MFNIAWLLFCCAFVDSHNNMENKTEKVTVDKEELRKRLTPLQYQVTQEAATERPFTGKSLKFLILSSLLIWFTFQFDFRLLQ